MPRPRNLPCRQTAAPMPSAQEMATVSMEYPMVMRNDRSSSAPMGELKFSAVL